MFRSTAYSEDDATTFPNVKQDDTFQLEPKPSVAETLFGTGGFFNEDFNAAVMLLLTSYCEHCVFY